MSNKPKTKYAIISLPYYKQGDDLAMAIEKSAGLVEALELDAQWLEHAANQLRGIKNCVKNHEDKVTVQADTHFIAIEGPEDLINVLIQENLAEEHPFEEDDEEFLEEELDLDDEDWDKFLKENQPLSFEDPEIKETDIIGEDIEVLGPITPEV